MGFQEVVREVLKGKTLTYKELQRQVAEQGQRWNHPAYLQMKAAGQLVERIEARENGRPVHFVSLPEA